MAVKKFGNKFSQPDEVITAIRGWAKDNRTGLQRIKGSRENIGRERRAIASNDDSSGRTFAEAVFKRASHALGEVAFALRTTEPAIAKPVLHLVCIVTSKADFQFHVLRCTQSVRGSQRAEHEPTMQRRRAFRPERGD